MEVRERVIKIKEFVAEDGTVFSPVTSSDERLVDNEQRLKKECEHHEEQYRGWYAFKNFKVDPDKLKEWNPENWQHFKWEFFRKYVMLNQDTSNMGNRLHSVRRSDFEAIDSSEKLEKLIKKLTYEFRERSRDEYLVIPWHRRGLGEFDFDKFHSINSKSFLELVVGSGMVKAKTFSKKVFKHLMWRNDLDAAIYLIEQGYTPNEENIVYALDEFLRFSQHNRHGVRMEDELVVRFGDESELLVDDENDIYHFRYFSYKPQKEFIDLLLKNFEGDYNKVLISLIDNDRLDEDCYGPLDVLHKSAKEKGIDSAFARTDIKNFIRFALSWSSSNVGLYKIGEEYIFSKSHWSANKGKGVRLKKFPEPELFENIFFRIRAHQGQYSKKSIEMAEYIVDNVDFNKRRFYFWLIKYQGARGRYWKEEDLRPEMKKEIDNLKEILFSRADFMNLGGGNVKGNTIGSTFEMRESISKENFYKIYPGLKFFNDSFELQEIIDVKRRKYLKDNPIVEKGEEVRIDRVYQDRKEIKVDYEYFFND